MANPNPQHTPTDGLGVAAYVTLSGTGLTNMSAGTLTHPGSNGAGGQGIGATAGGVFPVAQYRLVLSLTSSGGNQLFATLTAAAVDVQNNVYAAIANFVAVSYGNPSTDGDGDAPAWYNPSNGPSGNGKNPVGNYSADIASASASGATITITALNVGRTDIGVQLPTFDNNLGDASAGTVDGGSPMQHNPNNMIYALVHVVVLP
jgi:hypothetical protein